MPLLFEIPRGSLFVVKGDLDLPPDSLDILKSAKLKLLNIDGMYSRCVTEEGETVHPAAWTLVEVIDE